MSSGWTEGLIGGVCTGADDQPLIAKEFPSNFEEHMDLDSPVELLEPLLFVLNRLLEQVCARLRMHILAIGEIKVTLTLERNDSRNKEPLFHIRTTRSRRRREIPTPSENSCSSTLRSTPLPCLYTAVRV